MDTETTTKRQRDTKPRKRRMKKGFKVFLIVLSVLVVLMIAFIVFVIGGKGSTLNQKIGDVNLAVVNDGVYTGSYSALRWSNTVEVTVKDHEITDIEVVKPQALAKQETIDTMTQEVLDAQNLQVDAVSGATVDSKAFLKAAENALMNALG